MNAYIYTWESNFLYFLSGNMGADPRVSSLDNFFSGIWRRSLWVLPLSFTKTEERHSLPSSCCPAFIVCRFLMVALLTGGDWVLIVIFFFLLSFLIVIPEVITDAGRLLWCRFGVWSFFPLKSWEENLPVASGF